MVYNDHQAALLITKILDCSSATRHMKIRYHIVRVQIKAGAIQVEYKPTELMVADITTNALLAVPFKIVRATEHDAGIVTRRADKGAASF
jgi:hypothetical protein